MRKTIWCFGDSFTQFLTPVPLLTDWRSRYCDWKGYTPKVFSEILLERYNYDTYNLAQGGIDNYSILDLIIDNLSKIGKNDIIIVGWTSVLRFRMANKLGKFSSVLQNDDNTRKDLAYFLGVSVDTINDIVINRGESSVYVHEINNYIKLIKFIFKDNIQIHWSPFYQHDRGLDVVSLPKLETIIQETNGEIKDGHYSEKSHNDLAEHFHQLIKYTKLDLFELEKEQLEINNNKTRNKIKKLL
jgi:hypothetical protein